MHATPAGPLELYSHTASFLPRGQTGRDFRVAPPTEHHTDVLLQVVQPQPPGHHGEGFARAVEINAVSLLFKRALVAAGRRPVRQDTRCVLGNGKYGTYLPS